MKKKSIFPVIVVSLVLISAVILVGCGSAYVIPAMEFPSQPVDQINFSLKEPEDLLAYRWVEMAKWYGEHDLLNDGMSPGDLIDRKSVV